MPRSPLLLIALAACAGGAAGPGKPGAMAPYSQPEPPPDPAWRGAERPVLIRGGTVLTVAGVNHTPGYVLVERGRISDVGPGDREPPMGALVIDATGRFVTPGLIDTHSHLGVYPMPGTAGGADGNEVSGPITAGVLSEHGLWPQDPAIPRALAGGVTTMQVLPGSANLVGGRAVTVKLRPAVSARDMRFPGAPVGLKMACGENPKRVYGTNGGPFSRMGNIAGMRAAFQKAVEYRRQWKRWKLDLASWEKRKDEPGEGGRPNHPPEPPPRDLGLETLAGVLDGDILVHNHCYRADEMNVMLDLAREFGFRIRSFHHALEAYKLAPRLATEGVSVSTWSDWWGFKMEAYDGIPQNLAILSQHGVRAIVHSDSAREMRRLNQEAQKARTAGRKVGIEISEDEALRWVTINPAWALGIDGQVGSIEKGKMADLVVWDRHPLSVYARPAWVLVDGSVELEDGKPPRPTDFEIGPEVTP